MLLVCGMSELITVVCTIAALWVTVVYVVLKRANR